MKSAAIAALLGVLCSSMAAGALAGSVTTDVDGVRVELTSRPETPGTDGKTTYTVRLGDDAGKPVTNARVTLTARMADGMSAAAPLRPAGEPGVYRGDVLFTMAGPWQLTIRVERPSGLAAVCHRRRASSSMASATPWRRPGVRSRSTSRSPCFR